MDNIFRLWDRFDSSDADTMLVETGEFTLKLTRNGVCTNETAVATEKKSYSKLNTPNPIHPTQNKVSVDALEDKAGTVEIKAPLAGIFYRASSPDAEPFVKINDKVKKGDVIGIVEAMKMMNEITAPEDGVVASILVKDKAMVEFDQTLVTLR